MKTQKAAMRWSGESPNERGKNSEEQKAKYEAVVRRRGSKDGL